MLALREKSNMNNESLIRENARLTVWTTVYYIYDEMLTPLRWRLVCMGNPCSGGIGISSCNWNWIISVNGWTCGAITHPYVPTPSILDRRVGSTLTSPSANKMTRHISPCLSSLCVAGRDCPYISHRRVGAGAYSNDKKNRGNLKYFYAFYVHKTGFFVNLRRSFSI